AAVRRRRARRRAAGGGVARGAAAVVVVLGVAAVAVHAPAAEVAARGDVDRDDGLDAVVDGDVDGHDVDRDGDGDVVVGVGVADGRRQVDRRAGGAGGECGRRFV